MVTVVRVFAGAAMAIGVICILFGAMKGPSQEAGFYFLCGLSGLLSGALLFCFALIVDKLEAIRAILDRRLTKVD